MNIEKLYKEMEILYMQIKNIKRICGDNEPILYNLALDLEYAVYTYKENGGKENTDKFLELIKKELDKMEETSKNVDAIVSIKR